MHDTFFVRGFVFFWYCLPWFYLLHDVKILDGDLAGAKAMTCAELGGPTLPRPSRRRLSEDSSEGERVKEAATTGTKREERGGGVGGPFLSTPLLLFSSSLILFFSSFPHSTVSSNHLHI